MALTSLQWGQIHAISSETIYHLLTLIMNFNQQEQENQYQSQRGTHDQFTPHSTPNVSTGETGDNILDTSPQNSHQAGLGHGHHQGNIGVQNAIERGHATSQKPSIGDKIKGTFEELKGKVTGHPEVIAKGQVRKNVGERTAREEFEEDLYRTNQQF
ncbi:hypothetical protein O181_008084 [Austropuccinia psidii MF-1]|uniref:CsbD-like domain-containing protein n=1 Tax=Austropuccinia psidii MF-1 TaxID=1389203 RepID=A0A9Q3GII5_9BASI|nr:hypothetical protein [Austropuccinia psidii MF-1]